YNGPTDTTSIGSGYPTTIDVCGQLANTPQDLSSCEAQAGTSPWTQYSAQKVVELSCNYLNCSDYNIYIFWSNNISVCSIADKYGPQSSSNGWLYAGNPDCTIGSAYKVCCALQSDGIYIPAPAQAIQPYSGAPEPNGVQDAVCPQTYNGLPVTEFGPDQTTCPAPQSSTANLTVQAADSSYNSLSVPIQTSLGSGTTQFQESLKIPFGQTPTNNVTLTAPPMFNLGKLVYNFSHWAFTNGIYIDSAPGPASRTITLNQDRTAVAYYSNSSIPSATKWYYCGKTVNWPTPYACTETQNTYSSPSDCQTALNNFLGGQTTGACYPDNGSCQTACAQMNPLGDGSPSGGNSGPNTSTTPGGGCTGSDCSNQLSVNITADPTSLPAGGGSSVLTWTSNNASQCSEDFSIGGQNSLNGSNSVSVGKTTTYNFACTDSAGNTQSTSTTVTVGGGCETPGGCSGYYSCSNSCASPVSNGTYSSPSDCETALQNGACGVPILTCPTPPCNTPGSGVSIPSFSVNGNPVPPFHSNSSLACAEANGGNGVYLAWDAVDTNKCPVAPANPPTPSLPSRDVFLGWNKDWRLTSTPPALACQISSNPSGTSYDNLSPNSAVNAPEPGVSTDYALECSRKQYPCTYTGTYEYESCFPSLTGVTVCSKYASDPVAVQGQQINQSSQTKYNTLIVIQPPQITSFRPDRSNILIHQSTNLSWQYDTPSSNSNFQTNVPTDQVCYSGGGSGYLKDWQATVKNPLSGSSATVSPIYPTTYYLTCRNTYRLNTGCYAETTYPAPNTSATVNVFNTNLQETSPSSFLEPMNRLMGMMVGKWRW
ncbi:MAG TPA: hypothetical protein VMU70_00650, partial [Candidatus Tyrphobacter sp.]|nr:hypothetical protein [Candidatus Tyrphobacter sp.]